MNYNELSKKITAGERIENMNLRVCYYARVSTDSDVQLNSLDNQLDYYKNYIIRNKNWTYIDGYVDEGILGVRVEKRKSFKKMINDAKQGKFDLIITKEVSRFARDLEDSIHYIRELKEANVGVFFENQNLNTFDSNSELILNIMFNLAQEESKKLSVRVKFGHKQAIKNGHVLGSSNITGYRKDKCKLVIVPEEAEFIKKIFELYSTGEYGFYKLSKELSTLGYYNKYNNLYDKDTLKRIIQNPKYKGYYRGGIYETIDYRTKKKKQIPLEKQIIYKCNDNTIPTIVSENLWERANQILNARTKNHYNKEHFNGSLKYPLSSKIYCMEHNKNFGRSHGSRRKNRPTWSCGQYLAYRLEACQTPIIAEVDLNNILTNVMNEIIPNKDNIANSLLEIYKNIDRNNDYDKELSEIDKDIKEVESKKTKTLDLVLNGTIKQESLTVQFKEFEDRIKILNNKKRDVLKQIDILKESNDNLSNISKFITEEITGGVVDEFIRKFVDEIIVSKIDDDRYNIKLDIYLNLAGRELTRTKGAKHINGELDGEVKIIDSTKVASIENVRTCNTRNNFTYDVYIESI